MNILIIWILWYLVGMIICIYDHRIHHDLTLYDILVYSMCSIVAGPFMILGVIAHQWNILDKLDYDKPILRKYNRRNK